MKRRLRRLAVVVLTAGLVFAGAPVMHAAAYPWWIPGGCDGVPHCKNPPISLDLCKSQPAPQMPGRGFSGWIDPGPARPDPAATDVYGKTQYPPPFHTYDLGCASALGVPSGASLDTNLANWVKGAATALVAACNSLHRLVSPPAFLSAFDPLLVKGTAAIRDALYTPYIGLSVLLVGLGLLVASRRRDFPKAVETVTWMLLILGVATAVADYPVRAGRAADAVSTMVGADIDAKFSDTPPGGDPSGSRATLLTDTVLMRPWLMGELGSADSDVARKYGLRLLAAQTYTWQERATIQADPSKASGITGRKKADFEKLAASIKAADPDAYEHLKGSGRMGAAFISLAAAVAVAT